MGNRDVDEPINRKEEKNHKKFCIASKEYTKYQVGKNHQQWAALLWGCPLIYDVFGNTGT